MENGGIPAGGDQTLGPTVLGAIWTTLSIATVCVAVRCYYRIRVSRSFRLDDGFIAFAAIAAIVYAIFSTLQVNTGTGRHAYYVSQQDGLDNIKWATGAEMSYVVSTFLVKTSILFFLLRIQNSEIFAKILWFFVAFNFISNAICLGAIITQCIPLSALWTPAQRATANCFGSGELLDFSYLQGATSTIIDIFLTLSPLIILGRVKIRRGLKATVCVLISLGLIASATNIVRIVSLRSLNVQDSTYDITPTVIWSALEVHIGITAACIPTIAPFLKFLQNSAHALFARDPRADPTNPHPDRTSARFRSAKKSNAGSLLPPHKRDGYDNIMDQEGVNRSAQESINYTVVVGGKDEGSSWKTGRSSDMVPLQGLAAAVTRAPKWGTQEGVIECKTTYDVQYDAA